MKFILRNKEVVFLTHEITFFSEVQVDSDTTETTESKLHIESQEQFDAIVEALEGTDTNYEVEEFEPPAEDFKQFVKGRKYKTLDDVMEDYSNPTITEAERIEALEQALIELIGEVYNG